MWVPVATRPGCLTKANRYTAFTYLLLLTKFDPPAPSFLVHFKTFSSRMSTLRCEITKTRCWNSQDLFRFYRAVLAMARCPSVSVCLSVCLSVTSRCSTKAAKRRITQITPRDNAATLVFWRQICPRNSTAVTPYEGVKCRWGGSKSATFDK